MVNTFSFANISALIGDAFGHTVGNPVLGGIILLLFFLAGILLLRVPLDVAVVILIPLVFLMAGGVLYGVGMLPQSVESLALLVMGVIAGYFFLKFAQRW